ncbi:MAG: SulP family inorganic anion transporter [Candidatus Latescibacterota bacterium]
MPSPSLAGFQGRRRRSAPFSSSWRGNLRLAGIAIGAFVLVEMMLLRDLIAMIPQAVFAGILFKVGYDVFDFDTVIAFTGVFLLTNKVLRPHNPIRDLKPDERLVHED